MSYLSDWVRNASKRDPPVDRNGAVKHPHDGNPRDLYRLRLSVPVPGDAWLPPREHALRDLRSDSYAGSRGELSLASCGADAARAPAGDGQAHGANRLTMTLGEKAIPVCSV